MTQADVLTAIDDALDTGRASDGDPVTRELQELALALRADSPEPTPSSASSSAGGWSGAFRSRAALEAALVAPFAEPAAAVAGRSWWR